MISAPIETECAGLNIGVSFLFLFVFFFFVCWLVCFEGLYASPVFLKVATILPW